MIRNIHPWNVTPKEAIEIQKELRSKINIKNISKPINTIAGCDVSYDKNSNVIYAGILIFTYPDLEIIEKKTSVSKTKFPYIPGILSFRESPAIIKVWNKLDVQPDVLMIDGHGYAHPRRFGIASHLGVILDLPTIGCAKSIFIGKYKLPKNEIGNFSQLIHNDECVGYALRTKINTKPIFVSVGNKITLDEVVLITMKCVKGYRIPEPIRQAHILVNQVRSKYKLKIK